MDGILDSDKVTYTVSSDGKFYLGSDELTFNSSNANLNAQPNLNSYLSGAKVENGSRYQIMQFGVDDNGYCYRASKC